MRSGGLEAGVGKEGRKGQGRVLALDGCHGSMLRYSVADQMAEAFVAVK